MSCHPILLLLAIAVAARVLAEISGSFRMPTVVLEMALGIVVGPDGLGLAKADGLQGWSVRSGWVLHSRWQEWSSTWNAFGVAPCRLRPGAGPRSARGPRRREVDAASARDAGNRSRWGGEDTGGRDGRRGPCGAPPDG